MFKKHGEFDIVGNFSAHKHVRSEKDIYSVEALLQNNVIHAKRLLDLLSAYPPEEYFCVSTDKAANPVNIMGASKRIMEDLIFHIRIDFQLKQQDLQMWRFQMDHCRPAFWQGCRNFSR